MLLHVAVLSFFLSQATSLPKLPQAITAAQSMPGSCQYKTVVYYGQNSAGIVNPSDKSKWEKPLDEYCQNDAYDIFILAFMNIFPVDSRDPSKKVPTLNFAFHCENTTEAFPTLLTCPDMGAQIKFCQSKGKTILLSMGGATGPYGFTSDAEAESFAETVWNMFMAGSDSSLPRPFGDAIVDGIDLDIESGGKTGYAAFIKKIRTFFASDNSRKYYIGGAPQCVYPDAYLGPSEGSALQDADFDFIFVQFYNNFCGIQNFGNPNAFNFEQWANWASSISVNKNAKVYLGVPGHPQAAGSGYLPPDQLQPIIADVAGKYGSSFGGVMIWEVSLADSSNFGPTVSSYLKSLGGGSCSTTSSGGNTTPAAPPPSTNMTGDTVIPPVVISPPPSNDGNTGNNNTPPPIVVTPSPPTSTPPPGTDNTVAPPNSNVVTGTDDKSQSNPVPC